MTYEYQGQTLAKTQAAAPPRAARRQRPGRADRGGGDRSLMQIFAAVSGLAFLVAGVGGFVPGVTQHYGDLELFGTDSHAELLGLFRVSVLHNIVHLLFAVGLLAAARYSWSQVYLFGGAVVYLGVVAYGVLIDHSSDTNFLPLNDADNVLHLGLSALMIVFGVVGLLVGRRAAPAH